jgi:superfamily II DNA/RNA helicase
VFAFNLALTFRIPAVLVDLLKSHDPKDKVIVFCNTIDSCRSTDYFLQEKGFDPACYHGEVPPLVRACLFYLFALVPRRILIAIPRFVGAKTKLPEFPRWR